MASLTEPPAGFNRNITERSTLDYGLCGHGMGLPSAMNLGEPTALTVGLPGVLGHGIGFPSATSFGKRTDASAFA